MLMAVTGQGHPSTGGLLRHCHTHGHGGSNGALPQLSLPSINDYCGDKSEHALTEIEKMLKGAHMYLDLLDLKQRDYSMTVTGAKLLGQN